MNARILLVEDNAADAGLVEELFTSEEGDVVECVARLAAAREQLAAMRYDVVLLDLSLPDADGLEGVASVVAQAPEVPVVVMTGCTDDRLALAAVQAGAQDYLVKGQDGPRVVRRAVRYAIERHRLRAEREALLARERDARTAAERSAKLRDEVLGIVSHDLRDPIGRIVMAAQDLGDDRAKIITRAGHLALRIIHDLLDVTAIEAGCLAINAELVPVLAIVEVVEGALRDAATPAGLHWHVERAAGLGPGVRVHADVDRVAQALGNLIANAVKFTPRGGTVALRVALDEAEVRFRVTDTGVGIAAEHLPHLFDRYWQARRSRRAGAGLGLAIVRGIAAGHGGRIDVESEVGRGSAFTFAVPRV